MQMHKKGEKKKWLDHFEHFSFQTLVLEENHFLELNLCSGGEGEELKPFKFERNMRALRRSPKDPKMVESDLDHQMITHYCSDEWLTTYSNLDKCVPNLHSDDKNVVSLVKTSYF